VSLAFLLLLLLAVWRFIIGGYMLELFGGQEYSGISCGLPAILPAPPLVWLIVGGNIIEFSRSD